MYCLKNQLKMKYVYKHSDLKGKVFYIGCGRLERAYDEISRTQQWKDVAKKGYVTTIISKLPKQDARNLESEMIKECGLDNLTNRCYAWNTDELIEYKKNLKQIKKVITMPETIFEQIQELANDKMISWNAMARILLRDHLDFLEAQK